MNHTRAAQPFPIISYMSPIDHPLKVLHVLDHSLPHHSGYAFRSLNILREQQALGWRPFVVTSPKHELHRQGPFKPEESIAGLHHYRTLDCRKSKLPILGEVILMRALEKRLVEIVKIEVPDIIHAHSPILNGLPSLKVGKKFDIPVIYEVRALWEDAAVDHGTYKPRSWKYQAVRCLETFVCNKSDEVLVLSQGLKSDFIDRNILARKLTVVGNGVDPDRFEQNGVDGGLRERWGLEGKRIIAFIGSFYRYEGLDLLVSAVVQLSGRWPELRLLLVGGGEVEKELKQQILDLRMGEKVIIPGRVDHNEVPSIYALADILVYPRRSMRLTEIVTPLKPLEAMAMGKAIVASDVGGHKELIANEQTGLFFRAGQLPSLVAKLETLLADNEFRVALGARASAWVRKERSWKKLIGEHGGVYRRALGDKFSDRVGNIGFGV